MIGAFLVLSNPNAPARPEPCGLDPSSVIAAGVLADARFGRRPAGGADLGGVTRERPPRMAVRSHRSGARGAALPSPSAMVARGWLKASHRALDAGRSTADRPHHSHVDPQPIRPAEIVRYDIELWPTAYLFRARSRIRVEIGNGDSMVADGLFHHYYGHKVGTDTVYHDAHTPRTSCCRSYHRARECCQNPTPSCPDPADRDPAAFHRTAWRETGSPAPARHASRREPGRVNVRIRQDENGRQIRRR